MAGGEVMEKQFFTVIEASKELGLTEQTVRNYLTSGRLGKHKIFNSTVIPREEIDRYKKEMRERGER